MSLAALDLLADAQAALVAALDGGDIAKIEAASQALAREVQHVRSIEVWRATPELRAKTSRAIRIGDGARLRLGYLGDHGRRRLQALLTLGGRGVGGYGRDGRMHFPRR